MDKLKLQAEKVIRSKSKTEQLLVDIKKLSEEERLQMLDVIRVVENTMLTEDSSPDFRRRNAIWHGALELLTLGLGQHLQMMLHQTTGPAVERQDILARIKAIKKALFDGDGQAPN